jgi:hypothetical protein
MHRRTLEETTPVYSVAVGDGVSPEPFSRRSIQLFQRSLARVLMADLGCGAVFAEQFSREAGRDLDAHQEGAFPGLSERLVASGLREAWNRVLSEKRSAALGRWVAGHVEGTVLDLLCGDGRVGEWLSQQGMPVVLCEREAAYEVDREVHQAPFLPFEKLDAQFRADTVLVSTVLHHEPEPEPLMRLAAALGRARLVIVENGLEDQAPDDFQLLMDFFFNRCLNQFDVPAVARHCTPASWQASASRFGRPLLYQRREHLPGIPLPHHLFVIDLYKDEQEADKK